MKQFFQQLLTTGFGRQLLMLVIMKAHGLLMQTRQQLLVPMPEVVHFLSDWFVQAVKLYIKIFSDS